MSSFYVTTPIYYVNAAPHLGHAYTTIAADVLARHHRQRGEEVFFLTGTDEHGEPVADAAHALGIEPQELADRNAERFRALAPRLGASNDFFIRTTDPQHMAKVQEILTRVRENGYVYKGTYEGWYCPRCADFKAENEIEEGKRCPIHHIELVREQEENYFFKLSAFQEPAGAPVRRARGLRRAAHAATTRRSRSSARACATCRSRATSSPGACRCRGIPSTSSTCGSTRCSTTTRRSPTRRRPGAAARRSPRSLAPTSCTFWPADYHLIAKDILRFHAIYWPALLMAAELELPRRLFVHGYLLMEGEKMSKSLGNVLDPFAVIDRFGADALRFYLLRDVPFGQDGSVSTAAFEQRYESELANEYGNLASRTLAMVRRYRDGVLPGGADRPRAGRRLRGPRRARCASCSTAPSSRRRSMRSGSGCGA